MIPVDAQEVPQTGKRNESALKNIREITTNKYKESTHTYGHLRSEIRQEDRTSLLLVIFSFL